MFCEGQFLPIWDNETLFQLIGTTYGGDGESTFALPDLRGRLPIHQGNGFILAETGGAEEITLTVSRSRRTAIRCWPPPRGRRQPASPPAACSAPTARRRADLYIEDARSANCGPTAISSVGGSQPHTNFQPYLCVNFIISLFGIFPSPT